MFALTGTGLRHRLVTDAVVMVCNQTFVHGNIVFATIMFVMIARIFICKSRDKTVRKLGRTVMTGIVAGVIGAFFMVMADFRIFLTRQADLAKLRKVIDHL